MRDPRAPRTQTHVLHVIHGHFWQLAEEMPDPVTARGLSQTHGPLVQRQAVSRPYLRVCQPFRDAPHSLAGNRGHVRAQEDPGGPPSPWGSHPAASYADCPVGKHRVALPG